MSFDLPFTSYAKFYDSLYQEKQYGEEVQFVINLCGERSLGSILDLGCGTGGHDLLFAERGYQVTGVDLSQEMIKMANQKRQEKGLNADFFSGDLRNFRLKKKFDLVLSMFAVMSYQVTNADCLAGMQTAREHLQPGGIFIFDAWYGPAVLHQLPETRVKEFSVKDDRVLRIAIPEIDTLNNVVTVKYTILRIHDSQIIEEIHEDHPMRYFFAPEIDIFARQSGFVVEKVCPFMDASRNPDSSDWNVTWVLKAV